MEKLLTISQMAQRLSINVKTLNKYIVEYEIPHVGIGRNKRFNPGKVEKYLEKVAKPPQLPSIQPSRKIELNQNPNWDLFSKQLGL